MRRNPGQYIYEDIYKDFMWRRRYNFEIYRNLHGPDVVQTIKNNWLGWIDHVESLTESAPAKISSQKNLHLPNDWKKSSWKNNVPGPNREEYENPINKELELTRKNGGILLRRQGPILGCRASTYDEYLSSSRLNIYHII